MDRNPAHTRVSVHLAQPDSPAGARITGMLEHLPRVIREQPGRPDLAGEDHPMRKVTRQVAFDPGGGTPERAAKVAELFGGRAPEWNPRHTENRLDPLEDAFARGGIESRGVCLEIG